MHNLALLPQDDNVVDFHKWPPASSKGKSNEWFTPHRYIAAARKVMGSIDLDPASCAEANQIVQAERYYTIEDNGLVQSWHGRVWLNPPFGRTEQGNKSNIGLFTHRLVNEYESGHIEQAILLSTSRTDTSWFQLFWRYPICFVSHYLTFICPNVPDRVKQHTHGTIFVYFGENNETFAEVFSEFGAVIPAGCAIRRKQATPLSLWEVQP